MNIKENFGTKQKHQTLNMFLTEQYARKEEVQHTHTQNSHHLSVVFF